jgi:hypothetical protein
MQLLASAEVQLSVRGRNMSVRNLSRTGEQVSLLYTCRYQEGCCNCFWWYCHPDRVASSCLGVHRTLFRPFTLRISPVALHTHICRSSLT